MDNWKEVLIALNNAVESKELQSAVKAGNFSGEFEPSEEGVKAIKEQINKLYSYDSAISNPDIIEAINKDNYPRHKKTAMKFVEDKLKPIFEKLGVDLSDKEYVSDGLHDLDDKIESLLTAKSGKTDEETKNLIASYKKDIEEANKLLSLSKENNEKEISELKGQYETKELRTAYKLKANEYKWADAYTDSEVREAILDKKWDKLTAKANLKLSENGEILVFQKDIPDKELYEGTKKVTFQSMFEPEINTFLKKSEPQTKPNNSIPSNGKTEELSPKQLQMIEQRKAFMAN